MRLVHLALNLHWRGHARLTLLPGDRTQRLNQLLFDPGERRRWRRAAAAAPVLVLGLGLLLVLGLGLRFAR